MIALIAALFLAAAILAFLAALGVGARVSLAALALALFIVAVALPTWARVLS